MPSFAVTSLMPATQKRVKRSGNVRMFYDTKELNFTVIHNPGEEAGSFIPTYFSKFKSVLF
jgi:hypothetical protein